MSSINLLHYREWHGTLRGPWWSVWPITRVALAALLRRRLFWVMYVVTLFLFLMFFFGSFLLGWLETRLLEPIQFGNLKIDSDRAMQMVRRWLRILQGNQDTFAYFHIYQGGAVMVVLAFTGAVLVGNDVTHHSLAFYLAKPLTRWHYIAGKVLAAALVVLLLVTVPALALYAQHGLNDVSYFVDVNYFVNQGARGPAAWKLLLGIVGFGLVLAVPLGLMLVAAATWVRRTMPLVMVWTTLFLFIRLLASILVDVLRYDEHWRLFDLWNNLCLLGFACLGYDIEKISPQPQPEFWEAGLFTLGVCLLCLIYLNLRTRAVEVVK